MPNAGRAMRYAPWVAAVVVTLAVLVGPIAPAEAAAARAAGVASVSVASAKPKKRPKAPKKLANVAKVAKKCRPIQRGFVPRKIGIPGLTGWRQVLRVGLTGSGEMAAPPITNAGKNKVGWYPSALPGNPFGSVPLDAHTYPNGSALGNAMLRSLRKGNLVVVRGKSKRTWLCYQVKKVRTVPRAKANARALFRKTGRPRAVIVVCSGARLGARDWTHRTFFILKPYRA